MDFAEIGQQVLGMVLPVIGSVLTAALSYVAMYIGKKYKLDFINSNEEVIRLQIRRGIRGAEEMAARKLKVSEKFEGKDKAAMVIDALSKRFPALKENEALLMLNQELAYMDGVGASGASVGIRPEDKRVPEASASVTVHNNGNGVSGKLMPLTEDFVESALEEEEKVEAKEDVPEVEEKAEVEDPKDED